MHAVLRGGRDEKLLWTDLPTVVRRDVEKALGARVTDATRVLGRFGWTPAYQLLLDDGRTAFFKGVPPDLGPRMHESTSFMQRAYDREERVYRELGDLIAAWAPRLYGSLQSNEWKVLLLEDLGGPTLPPWTASDGRAVMGAFAEFHRSTLNETLPQWLPDPQLILGREGRAWDWAIGEAELRLSEVASVAGARADEAQRWLREAGAFFAELSAGYAHRGFPRALLHGDARSDNLRWRDGRLYLFDWPHASVGSPADDLVLFAQTIVLETDFTPEELVQWYEERCPLESRALDAAIALRCGFFAFNAWRPDLPGLPDVRRFQRQQLCVTLRWAARRFGLSDPCWLDAVAPDLVSST